MCVCVGGGGGGELWDSVCLVSMKNIFIKY